jgi:hypothetical protein
MDNLEALATLGRQNKGEDNENKLVGSMLLGFFLIVCVVFCFHCLHLCFVCPMLPVPLDCPYWIVQQNQLFTSNQ